MIRQAKAPSAFTHGRRIALAFAIAATALLALALAPAAFAGKTVDRFIGEPWTSFNGIGTSIGGEVVAPNGSAINETGVGGAAPGDVYVTDGGSNRINVFSAEGVFKFAFGRNVIALGKPGDLGDTFEKCTVASSCAAGSTGLFSLSSVPDGPGGELNSPVGIAINQATGDLYVRDRGNRRVEQFSATGSFIRAWGWNVVLPGGSGDVPGVSEKQTVTLSGATGGSFTLQPGEFSSTQTAAIPFNASATTVATALEGSVAVGAGNVTVTGPAGGPWTVEFTGRLADTDLPAMTGQGTGLTGPAPSVGVATDVNGLGSFEICSVVSECVAGARATGPGGFGVFSTFGAGIAVRLIDADVFVVDPGNRRVQRFNSDGTLDGSTPAFGAAGTGLGQFGSSQPVNVAVDAAGVVYASDSNESGRIQRYDTNTATFLAPISSAALGGAGTTRGLAVDPDSDGGGGDEDVLYVLRESGSGNTVVRQYGPVNDPSLAVAPTATDEIHAPTEFGTLEVRGLAINTQAPSELYVSTATGNACGATPLATGNVTQCHGLFVLDDDGTDPVAVTIGSPVNPGAHQVDVSGFVDAGGGLARYSFEYSKDGNTWTALPPAITTGGDKPVAQTVTGLAPNTVYRVRLKATKILSPTSRESVESGESIFVTDAIGPEATTTGTHAFTDTSAWLAGKVNPNAAATTYHFQWGKTTAYGNTVPFPAQAAGSGSAEKSFIAEVTGLAPDTTYHYRIVAENDSGTDFGADMTFTTRPTFQGFAGRAYEQVTPVDKKGARIAANTDGFDVSEGRLGGGLPPVSADGEAAALNSLGVFADADWIANPVSGVLDYQARRNPAGDGWATKLVLPPPIGARGGGVGAEGTNVAFYGGPGDSMSAFGIRQVTGDWGGFIRDWETKGLTRIYVETEAAAQGDDGRIDGASADFRHVVFTHINNLTGTPGVPVSGPKLYEWVDGQTRLVGVDGAGSPFATATELGSGGTSSAARLTRGAVSDDGRHIFFSTPTSGTTKQIYRRSDGTTTTQISTSQRSAPDPKGPLAKEFRWATPNGGHAFFTSSELLTDNANTGPLRQGLDLYRYEASSGDLIDISADSDDPNGAEVLGLLGASDDGEWVYYVAKGQVVPGKGVAGQRNVYLWHADGETRFIATLDPGEADGRNLEFKVKTPARVSKDGRTLLFESVASLTGYPNAGFSQLYVYEADADGGKGALSCASCRPDGTIASGRSTVNATRGLSDGGDTLGRALSDDGSRVFFHSDDALLPADVNGKRDVYTWEEGRLQLISTGKSPYDSAFHGASASGDDVFIATREKLVGQDGDDLLDVYDYRVGGGIPEQHPPPPGEPCVGESCKPVPAPQPAAEGAPSAAPAPAGNVNEGAAKPKKRCAKGKVRRKGRCVKKAAKRAQKQRKRGNHQGSGK